MDARFQSLRDELWTVAHEENPWFVVDKVKCDSVYIWTKPGTGRYSDTNVFDICADKIVYYVDGYVIPRDAWPYVRRVQAKLKEIQDYWLANREG
jgi:hypothetical protein